MRTTKFRFWDIERKEMIEWEDVHREHAYHYISEDEGIVIPMQFIGLKDKNGVDIYEGDIYNSNYKMYNVIFTEGAFCGTRCDVFFPAPLNWCANENGDDLEIDLYSEEIEIIGNIYQNYELLN